MIAHHQSPSGGNKNLGNRIDPHCKPSRAAMYVRTAADFQEHSSKKQANAIQEYAARLGIEIVKTYTDSGKSGLTIEGRDAFKNLISDAQSGTADYDVILVWDVTRWGRFLNPDEGAYYESICRRAGIDVQYVAEQIENDGLVANILKNIPDVMARKNIAKGLLLKFCSNEIKQ